MSRISASSENRGCLTCHNLEKGRPYLKSYEQGNPQNFVSNFGAVKKDLCQTCHTSSMARQDCLLCHKYHVNGVITPIMNTKIPNSIALDAIALSKQMASQEFVCFGSLADFGSALAEVRFFPHSGRIAL